MASAHTSHSVLGWLGAMLAGTASAAAYAIAIAHSDTMLFFAVYLTAAPLFMAGLGGGTVCGIVASVVGMIVTMVMTGSADSTTFYALFNAFPAALLVGLAMRYRTNDQKQVFWYPEGRLVAAFTLYPAALFTIAVIYAYVNGEENGLLGMSLRALDNVMRAFSEQIKLASASVDQETAQTYANGLEQINTALPKLAYTLPSILGCSLSLFLMISGLIAHYVLGQQNWQLRDGFSS